MSSSLFPKNAVFPTTHWTLVEMVRSGSPQDAAKAMEALCRTYWYPVYVYLRRSGHSKQDAEDLTQRFFQLLIEDKVIQAARSETGKLRNYLLGVLIRQLSDHGRRQSALKRGGGQEFLSFEELNAEVRYAHEPVNSTNPEEIFDQAWAHELMEVVRQQLREHFVKMGREQTFDELVPFLKLGEEAPCRQELARKLGTSDIYISMLIHRLRHKFRLLLQREVARTVLRPEDIESELNWLRGILEK